MKKPRRYTLLDPNLIKTSFPKSINKLKSWMYNPDMFEAENVNVPDEQKEQMMHFTLQFNARFLFDFFDDQGLIVSVTPSEDNMFIYHVNKNGYSQAAEDRNTAEEKVFMLAFEELEKQL